MAELDTSISVSDHIIKAEAIAIVDADTRFAEEIDSLSLDSAKRYIVDMYRQQVESSLRFSSYRNTALQACDDIKVMPIPWLRIKNQETILAANIAAATYFNITSFGVIEQSFYSLIYPPDHKIVSGALRDNYLNGRTTSVHCRCFTGEEIKYSLLSIVKTKDVDNSSVVQLVAIVNVDDFKKKEKEVQRITDRLQLATRASGVGIWEFELASGSLVWDSQMYRLYGLDEPNPWSDPEYPSNANYVVEAIEMALAGKQEYNRTSTVVWPNGEVRYLQARAVIEKVDGQTIGLLGTSWDITELKAAQKAADIANEAKSAFLANMSHEIRTPISNISSLTEILLDSPLNSQQKNYIETMQECSASLLSLVNDVLDYSKLVAKKQTISFTTFSLIALLDAISQMFAIQAHKKNVFFGYDLDPCVPDMVSGDPARIKQILVNLVSNAMKFTNTGSILIKVTKEKDHSDIIRFAVIDTGIGVPNDKIASIFEEFTQADDSTSRIYGGTGLGLSICKQLVALMAGNIGATSKPKEGSTFWFSIPLVRQDDPLDFFDSHAITGMPILLVSSSKNTAKMFVSRITSFGATVDSATTIEIAKTKIASHYSSNNPYSCVIIDASASLRDEIMSHIDSLPVSLKTIVFLDFNSPSIPNTPNRTFLHRPVKFSTLKHDLFLCLDCKKPSSVPPIANDVPMVSTNNSLCVLLAEDNVTNQKIVSLYTSQLPVKLTIVSNGDEALFKLTKETYDLVFMDMQMPVKDGLTAIKEFRAYEGIQKTPITPIVVFTSNASETDKALCLASGADDVLVKPMTKSSLRSVLAKWCPNAITPDTA